MSAEERLKELLKLMIADNALVQQKVAQFCGISGVLGAAFGFSLKDAESNRLPFFLAVIALWLTHEWWESVKRTHWYRYWYSQEIRKWELDNNYEPPLSPRDVSGFQSDEIVHKMGTAAQHKRIFKISAVIWLVPFVWYGSRLFIAVCECAGAKP